MTRTDDQQQPQQDRSDESHAVTSVVSGADAPAPDRLSLSDKVVEDSSPFVGRWNELISTTNWEKGRLIGEWRDALKQQGASVTEYSDEAWAQLVGGVTGQHVGRLRRVHERFGAARGDYEGLYWSHFQAALDWQDAEMWLEGAITADWSVAKMRAARWEAVGAPDGVGPEEDDVLEAQLDAGDYDALTGSTATAPLADPAQTAESAPRSTTASEPTGASSEEGLLEEDPGAPPAERVRPFEDLAELPEDVSEAFEQMKLAILTHKLGGWQSISCDQMLATLDALKALAVAPSDE